MNELKTLVGKRLTINSGELVSLPSTFASQTQSEWKDDFRGCRSEFKSFAAYAKHRLADLKKLPLPSTESEFDYE